MKTLVLPTILLVLDITRYLIQLAYALFIAFVQIVAGISEAIYKSSKLKEGEKKYVLFSLGFIYLVVIYSIATQQPLG